MGAERREPPVMADPMQIPHGVLSPAARRRGSRRATTFDGGPLLRWSSFTSDGRSSCSSELLPSQAGTKSVPRGRPSGRPSRFPHAQRA